MKKLHRSILLILLFSSSIIHAQTNKLDIGLELRGNSFHTIQDRHKTYDQISSRYGYGGGLQFRWNFSEHFSVQSGVSFEHKSYSGEDSDYPMTGSFLYTSNYSGIVDYFTVPLLARINLGKKVNFFFNVGGYASFLIKQQGISEQKTYLLSTIPTTLFDYRKSEIISTDSGFDYGLAVGPGIGVPIKKRWYVSLEFRDQLSLSDASNTYQLLSNTASLLIGVSYKLCFRE